MHDEPFHQWQKYKLSKMSRQWNSGRISSWYQELFYSDARLLESVHNMVWHQPTWISNDVPEIDIVLMTAFVVYAWVCIYTLNPSIKCIALPIWMSFVHEYQNLLKMWSHQTKRTFSHLLCPRKVNGVSGYSWYMVCASLQSVFTDNG